MNTSAPIGAIPTPMRTANGRRPESSTKRVVTSDAEQQPDDDQGDRRQGRVGAPSSAVTSIDKCDDRGQRGHPPRRQREPDRSAPGWRAHVDLSGIAPRWNSRFHHECCRAVPTAVRRAAAMRAHVERRRRRLLDDVDGPVIVRRCVVPVRRLTVCPARRPSSRVNRIRPTSTVVCRRHHVQLVSLATLRSWTINDPARIVDGQCTPTAPSPSRQVRTPSTSPLLRAETCSSRRQDRRSSTVRTARAARRDEERRGSARPAP